MSFLPNKPLDPIPTSHESFHDNKGVRRQPSNKLPPPELVNVDNEQACISDPSVLSRQEIAELNSPYSLLNPNPTSLAYEARFRLTDKEKVLTRTTRKNIYSAKWQIRYILFGSLAAFYSVNVAMTYFTEKKVDILSQKKEKLLAERDVLLRKLASITSS